MPEPDGGAEVVRVWKARASRDSAPAYLEFFRASVKPSLASLRGFLGSNVLERDVDGGVEIVVATRWRSIEAVHEFAGRDVDAAVVEPAAQALLADFDHRVRHYRVVDS